MGLTYDAGVALVVPGSNVVSWSLLCDRCHLHKVFYQQKNNAPVSVKADQITLEDSQIIFGI